MKIVKVTVNQLVEKFLNFKKDVSLTGVTFASVIYQNDVSGSVQVKGVKQLQKETECIITTGSKYESKIRRIDEKQGTENSDFNARKMNGKSYTNGIENPVVHADKNPDFKMLVMIVEAHNRKSRKSTYFHNGVEITIEEAKAKGLLTNSFFSKKKTAGRGLVSEENDFDFLTLGFDKIKSITMNKTTYLVVD